MTGHKQTTDGNVYTTGYTYKLSGALDEETYPSTRKVKNVLASNGDLALVQSNKNSSSGYFSYAKNFTYTSAGAVSSMQLGNGKWESTVFNSRLQPEQIALGTVQNGYDKLKLNYTYGGTANNGNVQTQTITVPGLSQPFIQTYAYDSLNRLSSATETNNGSPTWSQVFGFDRYGNRNITSGVGQTNLTFSGNRITTAGYSFDLAGNTTADPQGRTFAYDAENKQTAVNNGSTGQYSYDGQGKRVKKYVPASGETTIFVYDAAGKQIAEYSTIVYTGTDAKVAYTTADHLGSPRITTDANGAVISRRDFHPFGEEVFTAQRTTGLGYSADTVRQKFTGYERDVETGLDFAQARYNSSTLGRFSSPDPLLLSATLDNPQSWNRYVYVLNSPLSLVDKDGLFPSPLFNCSDTNKACLNDEQRRILNDSKVKIGKETLSGEKLYIQLKEKQQNAFVNITDKLASIKNGSGETLLSQVKSVTEIRPDRIIANVKSELGSFLKTSDQFASAPAGDHSPYDAVSYKDKRPTLGNVQFSLNKEGNGADIDMDIGNMNSGDLAGPVVHFGEVVFNKTIGKIFDLQTDQNVIRRILLADPKVLAITPSTDPKFNRRQK